ncbi:hypothetical protein LTR37_002779 [Vermiconidia calcicola]|uniref:Uncharacterized protein n=1 Tax=Vermiconidia calcicola TaxID=1690605 RepID=A0ACC3NRS6_9PEZI|nr:hypothetical protein LTR37_002779 [Vermiconidia calcicola]
MAGPGNYGALAGFHPAPDQSYNDPQFHQSYSPPPGPQHASYGPHSGHPIPPGYASPNRPPPSTYDPNYFPPPPGQDNRDNGYGRDPPRSEYDRGYERGPPSDAPRGYGDRPYAPSDADRHDDNQLTPFDEEKEEAGYRRQYEEDRRQYEEDQRRRWAQAPPPPRSNYDRRDRYQDDRDRRYDDRDYDDRDRRTQYSDDRSYYDDRDERDERDRRSEQRRRDSRASPTGGNKDVFGGKEGQRGLSAQVLGGAMGGLAGHEFGGGVLETLGGMVVGAVGAKVLENEHEKRRTRKESAAKNIAPSKAEAITGERYASNSAVSRAPRDDRRRDPRDRRRPSRGRDQSESDSYSSDESPPPRRRR